MLERRPGQTYADHCQEVTETLEEYVQEKPIQALLIAAGVGMLLGLLWKRS